MAELGFWDDLDNFDDVVTAAGGGTASLFDDTNLFAAEALDAASPPNSSPMPMSPASASHPQIVEVQKLAESQLVSLATGAPVMPATQPPCHEARVGRPWRGGSFLDSNCPLRRRVKVTITNDKTKDKRKKRSLDQSMATSATVQPASASKRPRTAVKMQTTLCFAPAGEAHQPRFHLDIRKRGPSGDPAPAAGGSRATKKLRVEKGASNASRPGPLAKASKTAAPAHVAPAPRAKTSTSAAASAAAARLAKPGKTTFVLPTRGLATTAIGEIVAAGATGTRSAKGAKLIAATANAAAKARLARTAIAARRAASAVVVADSQDKTSSSAGSPLSIDAVSFVTADLTCRLAEASSGKEDANTKPSSAPELLPALEAVNSAAAAYRAILEEDSSERAGVNLDLTADFDFVSRLLG